jgi:predicted acetyltransferase
MENTLEKTTPELVLPSDQYKTSYLEALKEFKEADGDTVDIEEREQNFDVFLQKLKNDETVNDGDKVPNIQYWLVEGDRYIGRGNYRPTLNENLKFRGGNIGYAIRPTERKKGYATLIMQKLIEKAKTDGLKELLVTSDSDNMASIGVIEKVGGVLQNSDVDGKGVSFNRYTIPL